jgi:hypothetical protein
VNKTENSYIIPDPTNVKATSISLHYHLGWWGVNFSKSLKEEGLINGQPMETWLVSIREHKTDRSYSLISKTLTSEGILAILDFVSKLTPEYKLDPVMIQVIGKLSC